MGPALDTVVSGEVAVRGHVHGNRDVTINGRLDGTVELGATLTVGPDAVVKADLRVQRADIHGVVVGTVVATEEIVLRASARVVGELYAAGVVMEDGARFKGHVRELQEAPPKASSQPPPAGQPNVASRPPARVAPSPDPSLPPLPPRPPSRPAPIRRTEPPPAPPTPVVRAAPLPAPVQQPPPVAVPVTRTARALAPTPEPARGAPLESDAELDGREAEEREEDVRGRTPVTRRKRPSKPPPASPPGTTSRAPRVPPPSPAPPPAPPRRPSLPPLTPPAARALPGRGTAVSVKRR
jgi:cytoskeletal protein CcmA (bactofilin family)